MTGLMYRRPAEKRVWHMYTERAELPAMHALCGLQVERFSASSVSAPRFREDLCAECLTASEQIAPELSTQG
jgi:hypothetical protein